MSISGKTHTCGHTPVEKWPVCLLVKGHEGEHESVNYAWSDDSSPWLKNPSALASDSLSFVPGGD